MKQSGQPNTQLHFHKNDVYLQAESCTFWNPKADDRDSGFCSNRTVVHKTTSYQEFNTFNIPELNG